MTGSVILINNYITCNMYFKLDALGAISSFIFLLNILRRRSIFAAIC